MEAKNIILHESIRMEIYREFSKCFKYPDPLLLPSLTHLLKLLASIGSSGHGNIACMIDDIQQSELTELISVDYSRLFLGPYTVLTPPYGSVYLEDNRRVMGDSTIDAIRYYRESGLVINENFYDVPDHVSVELEFIYFLIFHEIKAIKEEKPDEAVDYFKKQVSFLKNHFAAWIFIFTDSVEAHAETDFYKNLAKACNSFIEEEIAEIIDSDETGTPLKKVSTIEKPSNPIAPLI